MSNNIIRSTGKRKRSIAKVSIIKGKGAITINNKPMSEYLPYKALEMELLQPLIICDVEKQYDINALVQGGGFSGQTGAIKHGIAKALLEADENFRSVLKKNKLLSRDNRIKERKKYGLKKARKAPQFSKR